ncbi:hypothetical protein Taro_012492 [Colocasia esculenta]|uniref:Cation/H+ exchanger domain-containing protein n=1 Tax=Colocasia esculenta TaxID=4460 RepID=A0A843U8X9_COLES|nr:hypothetical protein [Colocasia esculenta]
MDKHAGQINGKTHCSLEGSATLTSYGLFGVSFLVLILAPKVVHLAFGRLRQTRLVSEMTVGIIFGNWEWIRENMDSRVPAALDALLLFTVIAYMFVTGLEMDVRTFFRWDKREVVISYAGTIATVALFFLANPLLSHSKFNILDMNIWETTWAMALIFGSTSSPVLTRLTTELKIGKSDIGRLAVKAGLHNDMVTTSLLILLHLYMRNIWIANNGDDMGEVEDQVSRGVFQAGFLIFGCAMEVVLLWKVMPRFMAWIDERNPGGKRMKGSDIAISLIAIAGTCIFATLFTFSSRSTAFLMGLLLQREGRVATQLISRINFFLTTLGIPLYLLMIGLTTRVNVWTGATVNIYGEVTQWTWHASLSKLAVYFFLSSIGKVVGTTLAALYYRFHLPEAIALGLLLNVKGLFHIFLITGSKESKLINDNTFLVLLLVIMGSIMYIPLVVAMIVWRARKMAHHRLMGLQWHDPASELRMVVGIHGPKNVPAFINIIEATRGGAQAPLVVYAMDLIELTDRAAATLVHEMGGLEAVTVMDEGITATRRAITHALDSYAHECSDGLTIRRLLAVSSYSNMHQDICNGAEDTMSVLVILPFHRSQRVDGGMDNGHPGHRLVYQKVLQSARCSVGILVDRGLAGPNPTSVSQSTMQVAVIFIGGTDDRESLIYAGRMAQHPGVNLTAIRFLPDAGAGEVSRPSVIRGHVLALVNRQERELQLDDACFTEFYERYIADDRVGYMEKYVSNSAELVATLRALQGLYNLFIVGAGGSRDSPMTAGMGDWAECPELGPIGDVLASSDFSVTASILVIQQHSVKKNLDDIAAEFAVI